MQDLGVLVGVVGLQVHTTLPFFLPGIAFSREKRYTLINVAYNDFFAASMSILRKNGKNVRFFPFQLKGVIL